MKFVHIFIFVILTFCTGLEICAQEYFNIHYKIGSSNLTSSNIILDEDKFYTTFINFDEQNNEQANLMKYNLENHTYSYKSFPNLKFAFNSPFLEMESIYIFGKDLRIENNLKALKIDTESFEIQVENNFESLLDHNFPFSGSYNQNHIFYGYDDDRISDNHREIGILKLDFNLNLKWHKIYNEDVSQATLNSIDITNEDELFIVSNIQDNNDDRPQILKLNDS